MKIDRYGEVLIGCIDCNRWGHPGDKKLTAPTFLSAVGFAAIRIQSRVWSFQCFASSFSGRRK
jgi:hypothetical protein